MLRAAEYEGANEKLHGLKSVLKVGIEVHHDIYGTGTVAHLTVTETGVLFDDVPSEHAGKAYAIVTDGHLYCTATAKELLQEVSAQSPAALGIARACPF